MCDIKAIETVYDGHKFRSRLEARWAVFFNNANIDRINSVKTFVDEPVYSRNSCIHED